MTKIILLGASGFIGRPLLQKLLDEKFQVKALLHNTKSDLKADFFHGDILDPNLLENIIEENDILINLVGQIDESLRFINDNISGSINVLRSCSKKKGIRIIVASSIKVYGENLKSICKENDIPKPQTIYGHVKLIAEKIHEHYSKTVGLDVTVLRFATLYGPHKKSGFIVGLIKSLKNNKVNVVFNNGNQIRDLLFVNDAVYAIIQAIKKPQNGFSIFNITSGRQYSINQIIKIIEKLSNKQLLVKLNPQVPDERCLCADNSKAAHLLGFIPVTDIEDGLKITIDYSLGN